MAEKTIVQIREKERLFKNAVRILWDQGWTRKMIGTALRCSKKRVIEIVGDE